MIAAQGGPREQHITVSGGLPPLPTGEGAGIIRPELGANGHDVIDGHLAPPEPAAPSPTPDSPGDDRDRGGT